MDHSPYLGPQHPGIPTCCSPYEFFKIGTQRDVYISFLFNILKLNPLLRIFIGARSPKQQRLWTCILLLEILFCCVNSLLSLQETFQIVRHGQEPSSHTMICKAAPGAFPSLCSSFHKYTMSFFRAKISLQYRHSNNNEDRE